MAWWSSNQAILSQSIHLICKCYQRFLSLHLFALAFRAFRGRKVEKFLSPSPKINQDIHSHFGWASQCLQASRQAGSLLGSFLFLNGCSRPQNSSSHLSQPNSNNWRRSMNSPFSLSDIILSLKPRRCAPSHSLNRLQVQNGLKTKMLTFMEPNFFWLISTWMNWNNHSFIRLFFRSSSRSSSATKLLFFSLSTYLTSCLRRVPLKLLGSLVSFLASDEACTVWLAGYMYISYSPKMVFRWAFCWPPLLFVEAALASMAAVADPLALESVLDADIAPPGLDCNGDGLEFWATFWAPPSTWR